MHRDLVRGITRNKHSHCLPRFDLQFCCMTVALNVVLQLVDRELLLGDQVPDEIADRHHADQLCWCAISLMASKTLADASIV